MINLEKDWRGNISSELRSESALPHQTLGAESLAPSCLAGTDRAVSMNIEGCVWQLTSFPREKHLKLSLLLRWDSDNFESSPLQIKGDEHYLVWPPGQCSSLGCCIDKQARQMATDTTVQALLSSQGSSIWIMERCSAKQMFKVDICIRLLHQTPTSSWYVFFFFFLQLSLQDP